MHHIDEHKIELYILGSDLIKEEIDEIEAHLRKCNGCRTLAKQMQEFYKKAEGFLPQSLERVEGNLQHSKALTRINRAIEPYYEPFASPVPYRPTTFIRKLAYFTRLHPIATGVGSFTALAAVVGALLIGTSDLFKDKNPAYAHLNSESAKIEIYNKENQPLWGLPLNMVNKLTHEQYENMIHRISIVDLNGDNKNEVLTTLPLNNKSKNFYPLYILSNEGKVVNEILFNEKIQYRGVKYKNNLSAENLLCEDFAGDGKSEIIVAASSMRSPNIIYRLSNDGTILGQYFHFGDVKMKSIQIGQGRKLVLFGQNDSGESDSLSYGILIVLDPKKLIGKSEASDSRGFGLPVSEAEMYVIRFPLSDMNIIWNTHATAGNLIETEINEQKMIAVWVKGIFGPDGLGTGELPIFEYIFDERFKIIEVKYNSETLRKREELVKQGILRGTFDQVYLNNLKNGVLYWNGKGWQKEPTMVKHGVVDGHQTVEQR